jgi:hypothetical protein
MKELLGISNLASFSLSFLSFEIKNFNDNRLSGTVLGKVFEKRKTATLIQ